MYIYDLIVFPISESLIYSPSKERTKIIGGMFFSSPCHSHAALWTAVSFPRWCIRYCLNGDMGLDIYNKPFIRVSVKDSSIEISFALPFLI